MAKQADFAVSGMTADTVSGGIPEGGIRLKITYRLAAVVPGVALVQAHAPSLSKTSWSSQ